MAKISSLNESCLLCVIKILAAIMRTLPYSLALFLARIVGEICFYILHKKRRIIYGNLKSVFSSVKTPQEILHLTKENFKSMTQNFVDIMFLPKIKSQGYENYVRFEDRAVIDEALKKNKGLIFLAIHSGSWELASLVGSSLGVTYNVVANEQSKVPKIDLLLNRYRAIAGAKIIAPGTGVTRDILRALKNNGIVSLALDQGGKEGMPVDFFGKTASMSTGALRLGIKLGTPVCPVWIGRDADGRHTLQVFAPLPLEGLKDEDGVRFALKHAVKIVEEKINSHAHEYLWFYKVYKYTTQIKVLVIDDGKTGHLRQSQAVAAKLMTVFKSRGISGKVETVTVTFKSGWMAKLFSFYAGTVALLGLDAYETELKFFLTSTSYNALSQVRGDWMISSGSSSGGVNFFLKRCFDARSICVLKAGLVAWRHFDLVIVPEHDRKESYVNPRIIYTKAALNLITPAYLKDQETQLLSQYSHLKNNVRFKIGVLLGGNTRGVTYDDVQIRMLLNKIKEAASHYNADILISTSRRTPSDVEAVVVKELRNFERTTLCIIANSNNSAYAVGGILSLSDLLIVSGESISMVSEAIASGKKTIVFKPQGSFDTNESFNKFDRFVLSLSDQGFILACSIKEVSNAIIKMMSHKITLKTLQDNIHVQKAMEQLIP